MDIVEQLDHYKNKYQKLWLKNIEIKEQLKLYQKILSRVLDIIQEQNKIIDSFNKNYNFCNEIKK